MTDWQDRLTEEERGWLEATTRNDIDIGISAGECVTRCLRTITRLREIGDAQADEFADSAKEARERATGVEDVWERRHLQGQAVALGWAESRCRAALKEGENDGKL